MPGFNSVRCLRHREKVSTSGIAKTAARMNSSRQNILARLKEQQREMPPLSLSEKSVLMPDLTATFFRVLQAIGGIGYAVKSYDEVEAIIKKDLADLRRIVSALPAFSGIAETGASYADLADFGDVDLFITQAPLAVAENGAVWLPENNMSQRILPYICRHLAVIVDVQSIVGTMHEAYTAIGDDHYGFSCFIAGPSKTADIEQSLVMGAHGPVSMRVFIMESAKG